MYLSSCFVRLEDNVDYDAVDYMRHAGIVDCFEGVSLTYLPIGNIILKKLIALIDMQMTKAGAQEVIMPAFVPEQSILWSKNVTQGTYQKMGVYFKKGSQKYYLMPTSEETASYLVDKLIDDYSFKEKAFYHTTRKYRDEKELEFPVRLNEFFMHDVYSFTTDSDYIEAYYDKFTESYCNICELLDLEYYLTTNICDELLGYVSQEFLAVVQGAKDTFKILDQGKKIVQKYEKEPPKGDDVRSGLEIAHVYKFYEIFSEFISRKKTNGRHVYMNGHGMGLDRVLFAVVAQHLQNGVMKWPKPLLPFLVTVITEDDSTLGRAKDVYHQLLSHNIPCLFNDRPAVRHRKNYISHTLGIPFSILVGAGSLELLDNSIGNHITINALTVSDGMIDHIKKY